MSWYDFLKNYDGKVTVNGKDINDVDMDSLSEIEMDIIPKSLLKRQRYRIVVKGWMSNKSGNLDFHQRWNDGIAMPCTEMYGYELAETPGMRKYELWDKDGNNHWIGFVSKSAILEREEVSEENRSE